MIFFYFFQQLLGVPPDPKRLKPEPPPQSERVMIYVRQDTEEAFTPLHLVSQLFKIYLISFHDVFGTSC